MTIPDRGGQEVVDSLVMTGHFGLCFSVEVNLIMKVLSSNTEALVFAKDI